MREQTVSSYGLCANTDVVTFSLVDLTGRTHVSEDLLADANDPEAVAAGSRKDPRHDRRQLDGEAPDLRHRDFDARLQGREPECV